MLLPKNKFLSHLQKACKKLGILVIKTYSPQAKGRVERKHDVYQDRFVKEFKLKNIKTIQEANHILENGFIDKLNIKFAKTPRNEQSPHVPLLDQDLNQILCWEYQRTVRHDWTFSFMSECYQIEKISSEIIKPKNKILVRKHIDGSMSAWYKNKKIIISKVEKDLKFQNH